MRKEKTRQYKEILVPAKHIDGRRVLLETTCALIVAAALLALPT